MNNETQFQLETYSEPEDINEMQTQLIQAEFNYIASTAFQSNEDRARVSQVFYSTYGTLIVALLTLQLDGIELQRLLVVLLILFVINALWGAITILQLVRLRLAWRESVIAMNIIKQQISVEVPRVSKYFTWTLDTIPASFKIGSVSFLSALIVSVLSGLSFGAAIAFAGLAFNPQSTDIQWLPLTTIGILTTAIYMIVLYWLPLRG